MKPLDGVFGFVVKHKNILPVYLYFSNYVQESKECIILAEEYNRVKYVYLERNCSICTVKIVNFCQPTEKMISIPYKIRRNLVKIRSKNCEFTKTGEKS